MKIAVVREKRSGEKRVAASPDMIKKLVDGGHQVWVEKDAGREASFLDKDFEAQGAHIVDTFQKTVEGADLVLKIHAPFGNRTTTAGGGDPNHQEELDFLPSGCVLVGVLSPATDLEQLQAYNAKNITSFSLDLMPRITRAQSMDVLSSQTNLAGYRAVIEAAGIYGRSFPLMMTAAGTVPPAKVLILGAGVAGLQAIATAKRLGAVVSAFDVRPSVKEQVESLGASFIQVEDRENGTESTTGYAQEMSAEYQAKQAQKIAQAAMAADIIITTALIPGKPAPKLLTEAMVQGMKTGSVIVDLAVEMGGNCAFSQKDQVVHHQGVTIVGYSIMVSGIAQEASRLYARNMLNFLNILNLQDTHTAGDARFDQKDEIIQATLLTHGGKTVHPQFQLSTMHG